MEFEQIPAGGSFANFKELGNAVEGRIAAFDMEGGTDFNGNVCPRLTVETEEGNVIVEGGQANLRRQFEQNPGRFIVGHGVRVEYSGTYEAPKGTGKSFTIGVTAQPVAPIVSTVEATEDAF